jgi:hypothetical protein
MRVFAIGIEDALSVAVKRLQGGDARDLDGAAVLGRGRQHLGRPEDGRQASLGGGDGFDQMRDGLAEGRQLGAIGQHDRLGKPAIPRHDATLQRNRDSSRRRMVGSGKHRAASEKNGLSGVATEAVLLGALPGAARHGSDCELKFCFSAAYFGLPNVGSGPFNP